MIAEDLDSRWDVVAELIDQLAQIRAERRSLSKDIEQLNTALAAASWEMKRRRAFSPSAQPMLPYAEVYEFKTYSSPARG